MAQSGYTPIQLYLSTTASAVPLAANLAAGELAINTNDGKLYYKNSAGVVTLLAGAGGAGIAAGSNTQIQFNNSGSFGASSSLTWSGTVLSTTGLTATGAITLNTTTNNQSYTTTGAGTITISSGTAGSINNMTIGGTTPLAGTFTTLTTSSTVTHNGGTANGVTYLNGSKVLTSGTAIQFDGTNFATTGTATATKLIPTGSSATGNGLYLPAANSLGLSTNGTNAVYINSNQNVGIGTSSPTSKLHVSGGRTDLTANNETYSLGVRYGSGTGIYYIGGTNSATPDMVFSQTGGSERMRITDSGNVGIGTSSPQSLLDLTGNDPTLRFTDNAGSPASTFSIRSTDGTLKFRDVTNSSDRVTIDSSGNLLVGTTSATSGGKVVINQGSGYLITAIGGTLTGSEAWRHWLGNTGTSAYYIINDANTGVFLAYGGTSWTANSDERLKDIIEPITDAANKVSTLRAVIGKFKTDEEGTRRSFLIAQDVQAVLPEAVSVGVNDMLGVQYTEVIPLLVAAIKEQQTLITSLTARIEALESR